MIQNEVICFMNKPILTYNETVKEAIALALIQLLKKKKISEISISEIVEHAGVSRSSYYRNFTSKEQVLSEYIQKCYRDYFNHEQITHKNSEINQFLYLRFRFVKQYREYFTVLRKHNLLAYIFEDLDPELARYLSGMQIDHSPYYMAIFASCSAGIIRQWIDNEFKESEEEMIEIHDSISKVLRK